MERVPTLTVIVWEAQGEQMSLISLLSLMSVLSARCVMSSNDNYDADKGHVIGPYVFLAARAWPGLRRYLHISIDISVGIYIYIRRCLYISVGIYIYPLVYLR